MPAIDKFATFAYSPSNSANDVIPVVPDDDDDLEYVTMALHSPTGGAVTCITAKGIERTFILPVDQIYPVRVSRVKATGTAAHASGIFALIP